MKLQPEEAQAVDLVRIFALQNRALAEHLIHVPNQRDLSKDPRTAGPKMALLRSMGFRDGASDYLLAVPCDIYHGLFLELKAPGGDLQKTQRDFLDLRFSQGYAAAVAWGAAAALACCRLYLKRRSQQAHEIPDRTFSRGVLGFPEMAHGPGVPTVCYLLDELTLTGTVRQRGQPKAKEGTKTWTGVL